MNLQTKIKDAGGIYKRYASRLEKLGIISFEDFLYHIPFRYDDYRLVSKIADLQPGEVVTIQGKVVEIKNIFTRGYKKIQKAIISDTSGEIEIVWFNQPYLTKTIFKDDLISLSGKVEQSLNKLSLVSPDFEIIEKDGKTLHTGRLVPVYPETSGISSKWLRRQTDKLIAENKSQLSEYIPESVIKENDLMNLYSAFEEVHFPSSLEDAEKAKQRLAFDELLTIQAAAIIRKKEWKTKITGKKIKIFSDKTDELVRSLPFELTIFEDFLAESPMNRLLEGDVGSGKTIVAAIAAHLMHLNSFQTALIAPTEILANQHYKTLTDFLSPLGMKIGLITSHNKLPKEKFDIIVGTHSLINDKIVFENLGLVVIDEQQRFGVEQRSILRKKGDNPHFLTMTATPIPRTVALTLYGDLSLSILDELPKNRKPVKTWLVPEAKRAGAYNWIEKEIKENKSQAFIVCPFIEESESMTSVKAASKEFENLSRNVFKDLKLALMHGKQKPNERNKILDQFKNGQIDILVATPIVEVGIDIPNATIIVIEAADRFGLAQLHQLRGRVGRGDKQSYCLLFTDNGSPKTTQRLRALETTQNGARLAQMDLEMRGAGQLYGVKQHGDSTLKIADLSDFKLIEKTRIEAEKLTSEINKYPLFLNKIKTVDSQEISPD